MVSIGRGDGLTSDADPLSIQHNLDELATAENLVGATEGSTDRTVRVSPEVVQRFDTRNLSTDDE